MTVQELIDRLKNLPPEMEVMILDIPNGGGCPRVLNLGPVSHEISEQNAEEAADCEERVGEKVIVMGYGCY